MAHESCPIPSPGDRTGRAAIDRMLSARRIAIVGVSDDPSRPSFAIASYLISVGKQVIPINPNCAKVLGLACYPSLEAAPGPIDVVNVFRRAEFCPDIVRSAIAAGARGVWLQSGIISEEARELAARGKIDFVQNRCIMVEHMHRA